MQIKANDGEVVTVLQDIPPRFDVAGNIVIAVVDSRGARATVIIKIEYLVNLNDYATIKGPIN